jgi:hypothetical protein
MRHLRLPAVAILVLLLASCGGGGDAAAPLAGATPVTLYHPSGRIAAQGFQAAGTTTRVGIWREYFDLVGSPRQWDRSYAAGTWDRAVAWREFNADGSTRNDWSDR